MSETSATPAPRPLPAGHPIAKLLDEYRKRVRITERRVERDYAVHRIVDAEDDEADARVALDSEIAALIEDAARLDWLDKMRDGDIDLGTTHLEARARVRWRDGLRVMEHEGATLREAIDAARALPGGTPA